MRILVVNWLDLANPQAGGAEIHLHETFGRLAERGHDVTVLASGWPGAPRRCEADGMEIHRTGSRYTFGLCARTYFRRHLARPGFDVIVEDLNKVPLFIPRWTTTPVVPLVHHLFGWTAFREANPLVAAATLLLEAPLGRAFRGRPAVAVSESTRDDLVRRGWRRDDITVVPNGIDPEVYHPDAAVAPFPSATVLYLGRLKRYKRVDLILRAVARLRGRGVDLRMVVAGRGDHRPALERLVERLGLTGHITFAGFVSPEEKVSLLRRSWVHALTSPKEGWGIANLEAAACGTPTVASDAPGLRDSVRDGETGFLVPHGDVETLADRIRTLVEDPELRGRMSRQAAEFARGFSWDSTADRVEAVLLDAAASRPTASGGP